MQVTMSFQATCCVCIEHGYSQQGVNCVPFCFFLFYLRAKSWVQAPTAIVIKTPLTWCSCNSLWPDNQCLHYETRVHSGFRPFFLNKRNVSVSCLRFIIFFLIHWWSLAKSRTLFQLFITSKACLRHTRVKKNIYNNEEQCNGAANDQCFGFGCSRRECSWRATHAADTCNNICIYSVYTYIVDKDTHYNVMQAWWKYSLSIWHAHANTSAPVIMECLSFGASCNLAGMTCILISNPLPATSYAPCQPSHQVCPLPTSPARSHIRRHPPVSVHTRPAAADYHALRQPAEQTLFFYLPLAGFPRYVSAQGKVIVG